MRFLLTTVFILLAGIACYSQTELEVANARLVRTLDALEKTEAVLAAKSAEMAAKDALLDNHEQMIALQAGIIQARDEEVKALRKIKCSTTSFAWGIIKVKKCQ